MSFILFRPVPPMHQVEGVAVDSLSRDSIYSICAVCVVPVPVSPTGGLDHAEPFSRPLTKYSTVHSVAIN